MKSFEEALDDIYDRAKARQIAERRRNKRLMTIAATCATLSVVVVLSVVFVWRPWSDDTKNDTVVLEGKNGDKKWISDIPGAVYIENPQYFSDEVVMSDICTRDELIDVLREGLVVIGDAENIKSFYIEEGVYTNYITTFNIKVSKVVNGTFETDVLKCVTLYQNLTKSGNISGNCGISNAGYETIKNPSGLFTVRNVSDDVWSVNGETYNVSNFADYYVDQRFDYSSEGLHWVGKPITIEEMQGE